MDDGQRYGDQSSQPVRALLGRRVAEPRKSMQRRSKRSSRRAPRWARRPSSTRRLLAPQFVRRLAQRGFR
jgi:hypothetical protein